MTRSGKEKSLLSIQERSETKARDGWSDPTAGRPGRPETANRTDTSTKSGGDRLPRPPGRRRPGLAVLGVMLIVLGAAVAGLLALRVDERVPVLVARAPIGAGQQITADDLAIARLASDGIAALDANQSAAVVGQYATQSIPAGRLIDAEMLTGSSLLTDGQGAVGIALEPGRFPARGLQPGDIVQVVRAVDGTGKVIAPRAVISSVVGPSAESFGGGGGTGTVVTVLVSDRLSPEVAAAAMADQVSLVLLSRGESTREDE